MKPESKFDRLKRYLEKLALPVLILPALAVTAASLFALITTVVYVAAESQPSDLLFPLRQPALQLQSMLTTDPGERTEIEIRLQAALPAASVSHPLIQPTLALAQAQTVNIASVGPLPSSTSESAASPASSGSIASSPSNTLAPNDAAESQPTRPATLSYTPTSSREAASPTTQPSNTSQPTATKQAASPTPTATSTSLPANTATPQPTATKQAASPTSTATSTSLPANTATSQPTATKQAASPTSTATSTSLPANTATPQPTATSTQVFLPSNTPQPTATSVVSEPNPPTSTPRPDDIKIEGNVQAIGGVWVVGGQSFIINEYTEIRDNPQLGDLVEVRAWRYWDGSLVATKIRKR